MFAADASDLVNRYLMQFGMQLPPMQPDASGGGRGGVAPGGVARVGVGASARRPTMALLVDARRVEKKIRDLRRVGVDPGLFIHISAAADDVGTRTAMVNGSMAG